MVKRFDLAPAQAQEPACEIVHSDCRTTEGITIGLIDGMIAIARVVAKSDLTSQGVRAALKDFSADEDIHTLATVAQPIRQAQKPYAYEYGKSNGDGTFSIVIERGEVKQTSPGKYEYRPPKNVSKEFAIKELFAAPVQPVAVPDGWREKLVGLTVSMDVSTGDDDAFNRVFGEIEGVMPQGDNHVILAVESSRNFAAPAAQGDAKDTERLRWLVETGARISWSVDGEYCAVWLPDECDGTESRPAEGYPLKCYDSWHRAIDAAITAGKEDT